MFQNTIHEQRNQSIFFPGAFPQHSNCPPCAGCRNTSHHKPLLSRASSACCRWWARSQTGGRRWRRCIYLFDSHCFQLARFLEHTMFAPSGSQFFKTEMKIKLVICGAPIFSRLCFPIDVFFPPACFEPVVQSPMSLSLCLFFVPQKGPGPCHGTPRLQAQPSESFSFDLRTSTLTKQVPGKLKPLPEGTN